MNAPLDSEARQRGGANRDKNRPEWEARFMGTLAAASRPLKRDHPAASDSKQAVNLLKEEFQKFPWMILSVVGRDGRSARATLSDAEIEARIAQMGGVLGIAGVILLRGRFCIFVRPLRQGIGVEKKLTAAMEKLIPIATEIVTREMIEREDKNRRHNGAT